MIVLHSTRRAFAPLGAREVFDEVPAGTSRLGDWYVNLVPSRVQFPRDVALALMKMRDGRAM